MAQMYKGIDVLVKAVAVCRSCGLDAHLTVVGDGAYRPGLQRLAQELRIAEHVRFAGALAGPGAVQEELDRADLFVLASRTEGLPRALVEAMARALPCIATRVGGIPELLSDKYLVTPGSVEELAHRILHVCRSPALCIDMSRANLARAKEFRDDTLRARRLEFYRHIRAVTERWSQAHGIQ